MFDPGIIHWIEATGIDRSYKALTLNVGLHQRFGSLKLYFEAEPALKHRYTIKTTLPFQVFRLKLPLTRDLFITPDHNIEPPMPRLLAIHRACCLVLHMSGAGEYIDKIIRGMEELSVKSDGTTELGSLVHMRLYETGEHAIML